MGDLLARTHKTWSVRVEKLQGERGQLRVQWEEEKGSCLASAYLLPFGI